MEVNIEAVMDEIRAEIKEKGYTPDMLSFKDVASVALASAEKESAVEDLRGAVVCISDAYLVPESVPVTGNVIVRFIKKIFRKLLRFYVKPIVMSQNEFNALCLRAFKDISAYVDEAAKNDVSKLENKISALEVRIDALEKENKSLATRVQQLEKNQ